VKIKLELSTREATTVAGGSVIDAILTAGHFTRKDKGQTAVSVLTGHAYGYAHAYAARTALALCEENLPTGTARGTQLSVLGQVHRALKFKGIAADLPRELLIDAVLDADPVAVSSLVDAAVESKNKRERKNKRAAAAKAKADALALAQAEASPRSTGDLNATPTPVGGTPKSVTVAMEAPTATPTAAEIIAAITVGTFTAAEYAAIADALLTASAKASA